MIRRLSGLKARLDIPNGPGSVLWNRSWPVTASHRVKVPAGSTAGGCGSDFIPDAIAELQLCHPTTVGPGPARLAGGDPAAVGAERQSADAAGESTMSEDFAAGHDIPHDEIA